mmetsp:Transcript_7546/g.11621  ORF Transcript_7546/g.11621 Transcript_7546/m.11621 type:complete len:289 (-) Transcript_7546:698-1564(-)
MFCKEQIEHMKSVPATKELVHTKVTRTRSMEMAKNECFSPSMKFSDLEEPEPTPQPTSLIPTQMSGNHLTVRKPTNRRRKNELKRESRTFLPDESLTSLQVGEEEINSSCINDNSTNDNKITKEEDNAVNQQRVYQATGNDTHRSQSLFTYHSPPMVSTTTSHVECRRSASFNRTMESTQTEFTVSMRLLDIDEPELAEPTSSPKHSATDRPQIQLSSSILKARSRQRQRRRTQQKLAESWKLPKVIREESMDYDQAENNNNAINNDDDSVNSESVFGASSSSDMSQA